ncbi:hypothetical protein J2Z42_002224 [Clostridium algifaecis]|uniref:Uncharacterized protein n=1 Tax=Clostridium algifaecis TaxID=1472040 RepID=A0ABS4KVJ4_9CLOT|nr:hypothetical protein [Clostridium algifaecis]
MLKISLLTLLLIGAPESFLFVFSGYLFYHKKFDKKRIVISTVILTLGIYIVRLLPIQFGIHTILSMVLYSFLLVNINHIPLIKGMQYSFILVYILFSSEILNIFIIDDIYGSNAKTILSNDLLNNLYFLPSIILFCLGIFICHMLLYKRKGEKV